MGLRPLLVVVVLLVGLGACSSQGTPLVEAHRGGAGYWPQNSRFAMQQAIRSGLDGIEFDLVLTADGVPVLSHDPWVDTELCTLSDGSPISGDGEMGEVEIRSVDLLALQEDYLCGGVPDPEFPNALLKAESIMSFDELLLLLRNEQDVLVHIDVKYEPDHTAPPEAFAQEVLDRWYAADLPNAWYVSANLPEALHAFEDYGRTVGREVPTSLIWPRFPPDSSDVAVALGTELRTTLGVEELVARARDARADGVALYWELASRQMLMEARREGLVVSLWTLNDLDLLRDASRLPVDTLITDYPGDLQ